MSDEESTGPEIDVLERGAPRDGEPQTMDRRLFMQLLVFECKELGTREAVKNLADGLSRARVDGVIYEDINHPAGIGLLTWSDDPALFVDKVRPVVAEPALGLRPRPELAMLGRTYSHGYEPDLAYWLIDRPIETVTNEAWRWAVWYPLRRLGAFEKLDRKERAGVLKEHAVIGKKYGKADLAHDVRLACHGLDASDNEFVIGLIGKDLHPLSHVVETMRGTRQTSEFISQMGPFFVGRAVWQKSSSGRS